MDHFFANGNKWWYITTQNDLVHIVYTLIHSCTSLYTDTTGTIDSSDTIQSQSNVISAELEQPLLHWPLGPNFATSGGAHQHHSPWLEPHLWELLGSTQMKTQPGSPPFHGSVHTMSTMWSDMHLKFLWKYKTLALKTYFTLLPKPINCGILLIFPEKNASETIYFGLDLSKYFIAILLQCLNYDFFFLAKTLILISLPEYI